MASHPRPLSPAQSSRSRHAARVVLAVALPWLITCRAPDPGPAPTSHPIQGGTNDTTHQFAVGIVINMSDGTALCSGALLAPNLVATARHCVAAIPASGIVTCPDTKFGAVTAASNIVVSTGADLRNASAPTVTAKKVIVPSGADQTSVCGNDIALLILSQNISLPAYVTPVLNPPMSDHTVYSPTVTAIGYGITSATDMSGTSAGTRRIRQNVALTCIPGDSTFPNCARDYDMTAAEFASGNGTCEGDSGSDAYEQDNFNAGRWVGFGVLSRGGDSGSTCLGGIYTRFDAWSALIIDAATQAATAGGYDVPGWAMPGGNSDASTGAGGATMDAGVPPTDAGTHTDGPATDAGRDGAGGAGASVGRDASVGTGGAGGAAGAVDAGAMDAASGGDASTDVADSGPPDDGHADLASPDSSDAPDGGSMDARADGNGSPADAGLPIDSGAGADGGADDASADGAMTADAAGDGHSGNDGGSHNPGQISNVTGSVSGCSYVATGAGVGSSAVSVLVAGLCLGLVARRRRRSR